jgi:hypothetical protein
MGGADRNRRRQRLVARYRDPDGRAHRIVLWGRLVLDLCPRRAPLVVAELSAEEGIDQARAVVFGGEFDAGYLERASAGERPLGRKLRAEDLQPAKPDHAEPGQDGEERLAA